MAFTELYYRPALSIRSGVNRQIGSRSRSSAGRLVTYYDPELRDIAIVKLRAASPTEIAFWESIQESNGREEYAAYLEQYPTGSFSAVAKARQTSKLRRNFLPKKP